MKFRGKLFVTYLTVSSLVLLLIALYGNTILRQTLLKDKTEEYNTYTRQIRTSAKLVLADMEQSLFNLYQSVSLAELLDSKAAAQAKRLNVEQALRNMCQNNSYFTTILAVDLAGNMYYGTSSVTERPEPIYAIAEDRMAELSENFTLWFDGDNGEVYLKKTASDLTPLTFTGMLIAQVDAAQLKSALGLDSEIDGTAGVLTEQWNILLHTGDITPESIDIIRAEIDDTYLPVSREIELSGKLYWLTVSSDTRYGWHIVHLVTMAEMLVLSRAIAAACIICGAIAAVLALILGAMITQSLTRNVKNLLAAMTEVSAGNFEANISVRGHDEIADLAGHFRWMQSRLRETTRQMVQRATEKQQAEYEMLELKYRSLQSQISPHFICNILSSINSQAVMGKTDDVSQLSVTASQYFRDNMSNVEKKFTSLRAEIRYVQEYMAIYRAVYGDENMLALDINEALLDSRGSYNAAAAAGRKRVDSRR